MTPITPDLKFVLWTLAPEAARLVRPSVLLTGAADVDVSRWLQANPWAKQLPRFRWAKHADVVAAGRRGRFFVDPEHIEEGDPELVGVIAEAGADRPPPLFAVKAELGDARRITAAVLAAGVIAARTPNAAIWEIEAGATDGVLAVGVANVHRHAVAQAVAVPGFLNANLSARFGVGVKVVLSLEDTRSEIAARAAGRIRSREPAIRSRVPSRPLDSFDD